MLYCFFLQILFHTSNFYKTLKNNNKGKAELIINYLIAVSEYPLNAEYFYRLKQLLGIINPDYSKFLPNYSQELGIDLINYLITKTKVPNYEYNDEKIIGVKIWNSFKLKN